MILWNSWLLIKSSANICLGPKCVRRIWDLTSGTKKMGKLVPYLKMFMILVLRRQTHK